MKMRLIDADAASEKIIGAFHGEFHKLNSTGIILVTLVSEMLKDANDFPTIESEPVNRAEILRLCNEIEMIIVTVCETGYTLQDGDEEAIMKRTKAIRKELTGDAGAD